MKKSWLAASVITCILSGCSSSTIEQRPSTQVDVNATPLSAIKGVTADPVLAKEVVEETRRAWHAYRDYAWGHDVLLPLSKKGFNWYENSLGISPIDAYSTLKVMGLNEEAQEIERYALAQDWNKDQYVQVFEVNIRILGGLLAIYELGGNKEILAKAIDFADRLLPAFNSPTGLPYHSVNLKTGEVAGDKGQGEGTTINVAQAATYLFEFGILSYYSQDPKYYQAAKKATKAIYERRSEIGLPGEVINVETGEWEGTQWHHLQAGVDAYYEYMYKSWMIFPDPEIKAIWDDSKAKIDKYLADDFNGHRFYSIVDMHTGKILKRSVSLYDAFFPAIQAISGDIENAERTQQSWHWLWQKYGLLPTRYHYGEDRIEYANSELNPEIVESAYYLHQLTGKAEYLDMIKTYWADMKACCRNDTAFNSVEDVRTMEPKDYLATYFYAETLKYFYVAFAGSEAFNFDDYIFNTEAHPFLRKSFDADKAKTYLGY